MSRVTQGILTGCDAEQEWLLAWWWESLRKHNNYSVCFIDFGMSEAGRKWCKARGEVLPSAHSIQLASEEQIEPLRKEQWLERYGGAVWRRRAVWFKKPLALLDSPFELSLWLDLDCEVKGGVDLIFTYLWLGAALVLRPEHEIVQQLHRELGWLRAGEINYNSGVLGFRRDAPILQSWVDEARNHSDLFPSDQQALSSAIWKTKCPVFHLSSAFNWNPQEGPSREAVIVHHSGGVSKNRLRDRLISQHLNTD